MASITFIIWYWWWWYGRIEHSRRGRKGIWQKEESRKLPRKRNEKLRHNFTWLWLKLKKKLWPEALWLCILPPLKSEPTHGRKKTEGEFRSIPGDIHAICKSKYSHWGTRGNQTEDLKQENKWFWATQVGNLCYLLGPGLNKGQGALGLQEERSKRPIEIN